MLSEMSASELSDWGQFFMTNSMSDALMDAHFATLKALMVSLVTGERIPVEDFSLIDDSEPLKEKSGDELIEAGSGICGGMRFEPESC
ncbi:phage tail assembly protein T [Hafnia paralvei]|uniref:phage tail assembly protein T n=1 Tax=Hafnia paralvei TaxID=546367 RepID=UPI00300D9ACD